MAAGLRCRSATSNVLIYTIAAVLVLPGVGEGPTAAAAARQTMLAGDIEAFVDKLASSDQFSGAVLLARRGQPLVRRGYGLADRARGRFNTPETRFMPSSVG
jgi:CubicO group peptidase (beta-lactamase class C family)